MKIIALLIALGAVLGIRQQQQRRQHTSQAAAAVPAAFSIGSVDSEGGSSSGRKRELPREEEDPFKRLRLRHTPQEDDAYGSDLGAHAYADSQRTETSWPGTSQEHFVVQQPAPAASPYNSSTNPSPPGAGDFTLTRSTSLGPYSGPPGDTYLSPGAAAEAGIAQTVQGPAPIQLARVQ